MFILEQFDLIAKCGHYLRWHWISASVIFVIGLEIIADD
jgi:hypothetical protein